MAESSLADVKMDAGNLYREEMYSDLAAGHLRKLVPVTATGEVDPSRKPIFTASTQVMTPGGVLPLSGRVEGAETLEQAVAGFGPALEQAMKELREELEAMRREQASQIVVPGRDVPPLGAGGLGGGGLGGGGLAGGGAGGGGDLFIR